MGRIFSIYVLLLLVMSGCVINGTKRLFQNPHSFKAACQRLNTIRQAAKSWNP